MSERQATITGLNILVVAVALTAVLALLNGFGLIHISLLVVFLPVIFWAALAGAMFLLFLLTLVAMVLIGIMVWVLEKASK